MQMKASKLSESLACSKNEIELSQSPVLLDLRSQECIRRLCIYSMKRSLHDDGGEEYFRKTKNNSLASEDS